MREYTEENPLRMVELFAGIGAQASAMERIGIPFTSVVCEIDDRAYRAYCAIHGDTPNLGDITKVEHLPECDLVTYSFPCLEGDTMVLTDKGWREIRDIAVGDTVYTDDGTYHRVTASAQTGVQPTIVVKSPHTLPISATEYHPFLIRKAYQAMADDGSTEMVLSKPAMLRAGSLERGDYIGFPIPDEGGIPEWHGIDIEYESGRTVHTNSLSEHMEDPDFWWTVGRFIATGYTDPDMYYAAICLPRQLWDAPMRVFTDYKITERGGRRIVHINDREFAVFCSMFGRTASERHIPPEYMAIPKHLAKAMLEGYLSGKVVRKGTVRRFTTRSRALALSLTMMFPYAMGRPLSIISQRIEGRNTAYNMRINETEHPHQRAIFIDGWMWTPITKVGDPGEPVPVYDITVDDRHTFLANGAICSNCTDISLAGRQEGFSKGSGTRSALLWEVERLLYDMRDRKCLPEVLVMENVDAIINKKNLPDFLKWCDILKGMGYTNSYQVLNAKDYGIPQNRKRVFMVSTLTMGMFVFPPKQPLTLRLKDMLESDVPENYYLSAERIASYESSKQKYEKKGQGFGYKPQNVDRDVESHPILTSPQKSACNIVYTDDKPSDPGEEVGNDVPIEVKGSLNLEGRYESACRVYGQDGVSPTLPTGGGGGIIPKIEISGDLHEEGRLDQHNRVYDADGISPTLCVRTGSEMPKIEVDAEPSMELAGRMKDTTYDKAQKVYDPEGIAPTMLARDGKEPVKIDVTDGIIANPISVLSIKRKHEVDVDSLVSMLRDAKKTAGLTNKKIAESLGRPLTEVEHWFREDECNSIPDPEIWPKLKELLNITDDSFDAPITEFVQEEGTYEMAQRCYDTDGVAPTINANGGNVKIDVTEQNGFIRGIDGLAVEIPKSDDPKDLNLVGNLTDSEYEISSRVYGTDGSAPAVSATGHPTLIDPGEGNDDAE